MVIDSWMELPKEQRPPSSMWDSPSEIEEWFDRIEKKVQTDFNIEVDDIEE